ncbi:GntR family transcriptional regulator [Pseudomonas oryzihabitans]|uniref:GntR family transcriptional regulator n=1 Tax=Pseudomonas oryzihabitans TaxID=47885 RepID=UPI0030C2997B
MSAAVPAPLDDSRTAARYAMIRSALREAILAGRAAPGLVLVEAPLAQLFGTSRVPVRQALTLLQEEGLIRRFEGRGYLIDPAGTAGEPQRQPLTRQLLGLDSSDDLIDTRSLGERVGDEIAACVSHALLFGHFRLDEQRAADHLAVSRAVVREALMRLRDRGLVEKEPYGQWLAGPLTAQAIRDDYEIRALLEPEALLQTAPGLARSELLAMLERLEQLAAHPAPTSWAAVERIEADLHGRCLAGLRNRKLAQLIAHSQSPLNVSRIFHQSLGTPLDEAVLVEHRLVLESLLVGSPDSAASQLRNHLLRGRDRTLQRLKVLSVLPDPELPAYLERLS